MQIFELHFNPKVKEDRIFDSFIYEPENIYEKRLGSLYMMGELTKALPQNSYFLKNLASVIKKEYYAAPLKQSCEASFRDALKKANEFLDAEAQQDNISWLGNLNFAALNFKDFVLNFTKVEDIKILLIRGPELLDISQNLEFQDTEPYPLKVFGSIATGKLAQNDKIIVLTQEVFSAFTQSEDFLDQLGKISDEKQLKEILKAKKQMFSEISGICLLLMVSGGPEPKQSLTFRKEATKFSFRKTFLTPFHKFKFKMPSIKLPSPKFPSLKMPRAPKIPKVKFAIPKTPRLWRGSPSAARLYKSGGLIIILILILAASFFIFGNEKKKELKDVQQKIDEVQSKIIMAENFLILKDEEKATILFQEAWDIVSPLTKAGVPLRNEALSLQKTIAEHLNH